MSATSSMAADNPAVTTAAAAIVVINQTLDQGYDKNVAGENAQQKTSRNGTIDPPSPPSHPLPLSYPEP
jgi:hypothetical protein